MDRATKWCLITEGSEMKLKVKKIDQGPILARKGDVGVGGAGGAGPITIETGGGGTIGGPLNADMNAAIGYSCSF